MGGLEVQERDQGTSYSSVTCFFVETCEERRAISAVFVSISKLFSSISSAAVCDNSSMVAKASKCCFCSSLYAEVDCYNI